MTKLTCCEIRERTKEYFKELIERESIALRTQGKLTTNRGGVNYENV